MTIIRNTEVDKNYGRGSKLPLLYYKNVWVRFHPSVYLNWEKDMRASRYWDRHDKKHSTILVPKEFT